MPPSSKGKERGLAPLSGQAQGPRWAPGCTRPPATAGGAQDQGWRRPPPKGKGKRKKKKEEKERKRRRRRRRWLAGVLAGDGGRRWVGWVSPTQEKKKKKKKKKRRRKRKRKEKKRKRKKESERGW